MLVKFPTFVSTCLVIGMVASGCSGKKDKKKNDPSPDGIAPSETISDQSATPEEKEKAAQEAEAAARLRREISIDGVLHTNYYNRATATPYFQSATELKDLFPDISNPKTSQLCLPTIMSYELYTQVTAKPALTNPQAESYLARPITEQVREMYRVCETDRFRGTTTPQAANCAVQAAAGTGLKSQVHVLGADAKWKAYGYYISGVSVDERAVETKDIINSIANRASMMFLIGFYESNDGINFERRGGHFISVTATGVSNTTADAKKLKVWIVDPARPGQEKPTGTSPFNGTMAPIARHAESNLDPLITLEVLNSGIEAGSYRIFVESAIHYSLSVE